MASAAAALKEPETIRTVIYEEDRQLYLNILHRHGRRFVTVIELLSPANKAGAGCRDYFTRRYAVLWQDVHLVEHDLLAAGERVPMARPLPPGDAYAIVARSEQRPDCQVYTWSLPDRPTAIPIPLLAPDPDVVIHLAEVYALAVARGRYARSVDYRATLDLPIRPDSLGWACDRARNPNR